MDQTRDDADSYRRVEVITGALRRRYWSAAEKSRIVAESAQASANISEVARRHGVSRGLLSIWRRQARQISSEGGAFVQLQVTDGGGDPEASQGEGRPSDCAATVDKARIEISIGGATVRVPDGFDSRTLERIVTALRAAR
jgi:transposase